MRRSYLYIPRGCCSYQEKDEMYCHMRYYYPGLGNYPEVCLDLTEKQFFFRGMSVMSDAQGFYEKITEWILRHKAHFPVPLVLRFQLYYVNTASIKAINEMIRSLVQAGIATHLHGIYHEPTDNQEVLDFLAELARIHQVPYTQEGLR